MDISSLSEQCEQYILAAMLSIPESIEKIIPLIKIDDFQNPSHQKIFKAITDIFAQDAPVNDFTVTTKLKNNNQLEEIGGQIYLLELIDTMPGMSMVSHYAHQLQAFGIQRKVKDMALSFISDIDNPSVDFNLTLNNYVTQLTNIQTRTVQSEILSMSDVAFNATTELENLQSGKIKPITTGMSFIDNKVGGFLPGELITIAGVTGVGKTNLTLQFADHIAYKNQIPVLYIPLEMTPNSLLRRLVLGYAKTLNSYVLRSGKLNDDQWLEWTSISTNLTKAKIFIPSKPDLSFADIPSLVQKAVNDHNIQSVFIDYMQLLKIEQKFESDTSKVRHISQGLKIIARNKNISLFSVSQFRKLSNPNKMPTLDDLYGSSAIPQDSDYVIFIHREHEGDDTNVFKDEGIIEISKGRDAKAGFQPVIFKNPRYFEVDTVHQP